MEPVLTGKTISIDEEERIKAEDVIGSASLDKNPFEIADGGLKITFKVKSRSGERKEPYYVMLPFKKEGESFYKMEKGEIVHSCPKYTNRLMSKGILCHHINAAIAFASENSGAISGKIEKRYGMKSIWLDLGEYIREPKDVANVLKSVEKIKKLKPWGRRELLSTYKKLREQ